MRRPYAQNFPLEGPLVSIKEGVMFRRSRTSSRSIGQEVMELFPETGILDSKFLFADSDSMGHANNSPGTSSGLLPVTNKVLSEHSSSILCLHNLGLHLSFYSTAECVWSEPHSLEHIYSGPFQESSPFPRTMPWSVRRASDDVTRTKHFQTGLTPVAKTKTFHSLLWHNGPALCGQSKYSTCWF